MKEISRKELFVGSGIFVVTVVKQSWKIVTNGLRGIGSNLCLGFETKEAAVAASQGKPVVEYEQTCSYYERFGKKVD